MTSRGNRSRSGSQREQVSAYRVQLCIILVKQPAGAKCSVRHEAVVVAEEATHLLGHLVHTVKFITEKSDI